MVLLVAGRAAEVEGLLAKLQESGGLEEWSWLGCVAIPTD